MARELHDSTGQDLVALATMLGQLRTTIPSVERKSRRLLSQCRALADKCIRDVRTLSYVLHPPVLDDAGLRDAIRDYVKGFTKRSGIQVELELSPHLERMAREREMALFRGRTGKPDQHPTPFGKSSSQDTDSSRLRTHAGN